MTAVAFHPGGHWVATADHQRRRPVAAFQAAIPRSSAGTPRKVAGLAIAPDGSWIATSSWDSTVRV